jgi:hypothetical protein
LYVHPSGDERIKLEEKDFNSLMGKVESKILELVLGGKEAPEALWYSYSGGRGLIAPKDQKSSEQITQMITSIMLKGKKGFRVWHKGQFGETRLVTGLIGERVANMGSGADILKCLLRQNKLEGNAQSPKISEVLRFAAGKSTCNTASTLSPR